MTGTMLGFQRQCVERVHNGETLGQGLGYVNRDRTEIQSHKATLISLRSSPSQTGTRGFNSGHHFRTSWYREVDLALLLKVF